MDCNALECHTEHNVPFLEKLNALIDQGLQQQRTLQALQAPREYLGASHMGVACGRALQYEYQQVPRDEDFSGRSLRIFDIGHVLEERAREWLRQAGFTLVTHFEGKPTGFSAARGRIKGHVDGVIVKAPHDLEMGGPALWECKTMNSRTWKETVSKGLCISKPEYAVQIAVYQAYIPDMSAHPALFTAINKDTAELYHELIPFNASLAQEASDRAVQILRDTQTGHLYPRITTDPQHYVCRFCPWQTQCWKESPPKGVLPKEDSL